MLLTEDKRSVHRTQFEYIFGFPHAGHHIRSFSRGFDLNPQLSSRGLLLLSISGLPAPEKNFASALTHCGILRVRISGSPTLKKNYATNAHRSAITEPSKCNIIGSGPSYKMLCDEGFCSLLSFPLFPSSSQALPQ
jgi:hypothetical protein